MRRLAVFVLLFLALLFIPFGARLLRFYDLGGSAHVPPLDFELDGVPDLVPTPAFSNVAFEPGPNRGLVLLDRAHDNEFSPAEIAFLDGQLAARGFELIDYAGEDLAGGLRQVNAFIVITPLKAFGEDEILAVDQFVSRGGRLLLIGDPTRYSADLEEDEFGFVTDVKLTDDELPLNSLANNFGIIFGGDYLYNTVFNEGNFRNIIVDGARQAEQEVTEGLGKVVFYGAHSVRASRDSLAIFPAGEGTWSSATDRPGGLTIGALAADGRVLALGDVNFLIEPYATNYDNGQLVANIADFLSVDERDFVLVDFPYFFTRPVDLVYTGAPDLGPDAFDEVVSLQEAFRRAGQSLSLAAEQSDYHDAIYLGLYNQASDVEKALEAAGIAFVFDPPLEKPGTGLDDAAAEGEPAEPTEEIRLIQSPFGSVQMAGTALLLLDESIDGRSVIGLAASGAGLQTVAERLLDMVPRDAGSVLSDCVVTDNLALCPTGITDEPVEYELESGGTPESPPEDETGEQENGDAVPVEGAFDPTDVGAILMGTISLGETVAETLDVTTGHAWRFSDGPVTVDIRVQTEAPTVDLVLSLYDVNGDLMEESDNGFSGDDEWLIGVEIPDEQTVTIVVRDFYDEGGPYTLTVEEGAPAEGVFIFADDDGVAQNTGFTSAEAYQALIGDRVPSTIWRASEDGPLSLDLLLRYEAVIWTTGDYRNAESLDDPDSGVLLNYLFFGESGRILISGATPALFEPAETSALGDLVVTDADSPLLSGLEPSALLSLDQSYEAVVVTEDLLDTEDVVLLRRGAGSDNTGEPAAWASEDREADTRVVLLGFPFVGLSEDMQGILLANILDWLLEQ